MRRPSVVRFNQPAQLMLAVAHFPVDAGLLNVALSGEALLLDLDLAGVAAGSAFNRGAIRWSDRR